MALQKIDFKKVLGNILKLVIKPVGSTYITANKDDNPNTTLGYGTWTLIDKRFKYQWISSGFTWNTTNTTDGTFEACLHGNTVELRFYWKNKVAFSDTTTVLGTLDPSAVGISGGHGVFTYGMNDDLGAIAMVHIKMNDAPNSVQVSVWDWVTRATSYPTGTGYTTYVDFTYVLQGPSTMIDSFCDEFVWKRTA